jgi:hypothetical protein
MCFSSLHHLSTLDTVTSLNWDWRGQIQLIGVDCTVGRRTSYVTVPLVASYTLWRSRYSHIKTKPRFKPSVYVGVINILYSYDVKVFKLIILGLILPYYTAIYFNSQFVYTKYVVSPVVYMVHSMHMIVLCILTSIEI